MELNMNNIQRLLYFKNFGISFASKVFMRQLCINKHLVPYMSGTDSLNELKLARIHREFSGFIQEKIDQWNQAEHRDGSRKNCIWLFWYTGDPFDKPILRMCYDSVAKHKPEGTQIILVTKDNLHQYIELPDYIQRKVDQGLISLTHLSDIVRFKLLSKWGGTWFDATVFALRDFPMIHAGDIWTMKRPNIDVQSISKGKWTGFAIGGSPNILFYLMSEFFDEYWKRYDVLIDFFLIDLMLEYLYRNVEAVRNLFDAVPFNNVNVQKLWTEMNAPYDEEAFRQITEDTSLFKLSYKLDWHQKTAEGRMTNYGKIEGLTYDG